MLILIAKDREGNHHYTGFQNATQIDEAMRSNFNFHSLVYVEKKSSVSEIRDKMFKFLQANSLPAHPQLSPIDPQGKEGEHVIAYKRNLSLGIEVLNTFFFCDESELTEEEKEKVQKYI